MSSRRKKVEAPIPVQRPVYQMPVPPNKQILVVSEDAPALSPEQAKGLEDCGYIVVRGEPGDFAVIDALTIPEKGSLLRAALRAIVDADQTEGCRTRFGRYLAGELLR